eukprot:COSAG06_NODE_1014_length_11069_cov_244.892160_7_plen_70_part_00
MCECRATCPVNALTLREVPIGGQNADLGGVFVTSFGEGVQYVAPALPGNSRASTAWVLELKLGRGGGWW